ncbi:hypothetical protein GCM10011415_05710 [Salipiger pallidus]|uniref:Uncharacterized protein n=1 Tax=Salipiger pallidus TaxID=1775170 RepID=A0A8J3EF47_9RHOB|nr:hypothetical protein [Salipiger pallidus]GGG62307.1 hypothetical protein GCM10011415_05710 [Salipiger pallidus]
MERAPTPDGPSSPTMLNRITGSLLAVITLLVICREWLDSQWQEPVLAALMAALTAALFVQVRPGRKAFVVVAALLTAALILRLDDWQSVLARGVAQASFIAAFFSALATLRSAAEPSETIRRSGDFLAQQPPGRRYLALTVGGSAFALLLNYGAIALLGSLATAAARSEPDPEIREHRRRRMLLAIQRGFVSSLPWSPLSFAIAISTALIPGASWSAALVPCIVTALLMTLIGWGLDTAFKPRLSQPPPTRTKPEGSWALLTPLLFLLGLLVCSVFVLGRVVDVRVVGLVLLIVPAMALGWTVLQARGGGAAVSARMGRFVFHDLPGYRSEVLLLTMAGYIGTIGAPLLAPLVKASGFHPEDLPTWLVLAALVWIIPLCGQIAMNPILAVTLIAPLLPSPDVLGITPAAMVTAITGGWALGGISSPFTATTMLTGSFGGVSAHHVGVRWNGGYMLALLVVIPLWVLLYAFVIG